VNDDTVGVKELGHLVLYVRDLTRSVAFYRDVLGWRQVVGEGSIGFPAAMFSGGRTHHELLLIEVG
jgi:catechol 2,3-dioxygenase